MRIRTGFLGLGAMGWSHLKTFQEQHSRTIEVVAICARTQTSLARGLSVAPSARTFNDPENLIALDLDAVVVSTPNWTHVPLALQVLRTDKHLLLEKPCGITREECHQLLRASEDSKRVVMIGHELRYSPYFHKIQQLVQAGDIGAPRMVWTREFRGPFQTKSENWIEDSRKSGGTLVDKNCHHFDLMNWWAGARPRRVAAFGGCAVNGALAGEHQVNDHATVSWEYENGVRGTLQLCMFARDFPHEELEMGIIGDAGMLQTCIVDLEILQWRRGAGQKEPVVHKVEATRGTGWGGHLGFAEIHQAFVDAIVEGRQPLTTPRDCVDGTLLAIAAEEAIKTGTVVEINPP